MWTKKAKLDVEEKKRKKRGMTLNTALTPTHRQKPTHKGSTGAVCVGTTVSCNGKTDLQDPSRKKYLKIILLFKK